MKEIILVKNGELALKGQNRRTFEEVLIKNIKNRLHELGTFQIDCMQSTIYIEPKAQDTDLGEAVERLQTVFGIAGLSRARVVEKDMEVIKEASAEYLESVLLEAGTFKVEAKRADKRFPFKSPEICASLGEYLLEKFPHLRVDVSRPEVVVNVEIREKGAYLRAGQLPGAGGMPVGTGGKAAILISGGIDSPVAAYMMAKRGVQLTAVHFASPPYTSERAELKVIDLLTQISKYSGRIKMYTVPFTKIQEEIREHCPEELFTLVMRRFMMRISERIARQNDCLALITGESLGQVASQTIQAMVCTDGAVSMPVFRPLIGMDKNEIVVVSRKIGTFETSIQPYEDCCTVFTPRHPRTKPKPELLMQAESALDLEGLASEAAEGASLRWIG